MSNNSKARQVHGQAAHSREDGNSLKALQLAEEARIEYAKEEDKLGFAEIHGEMALTLGHIADKQDTPFFKVAFLITARNTALTGVEIAERSEDNTALAIPYTRLGKAYEDLNEFDKAKISYQKALENMENNPAKRHNRPGVIADTKIRVYTLNYRLGDKSGLEKTLSALKDLETSDEPKYNKDVWLSGGFMRLADILRSDDPKKAQSYLEKAKEIIDSNPDLKIRKTQWEKLAKSF